MLYEIPKTRKPYWSFSALPFWQAGHLPKTRPVGPGRTGPTGCKRTRSRRGKGACAAREARGSVEVLVKAALRKRPEVREIAR